MSRCQFTLKDSQFEGEAGDLVVALESLGLVMTCSFRDTTADALEFFACDVMINDCRFRNIGDEAVAADQGSPTTLWYGPGDAVGSFQVPTSVLRFEQAKLTAQAATRATARDL